MFQPRFALFPLSAVCLLLTSSPGAAQVGGAASSNQPVAATTQPGAVAAPHPVAAPNATPDGDFEVDAAPAAAGTATSPGATPVVPGATATSAPSNEVTPSKPTNVGAAESPASTSVASASVKLPEPAPTAETPKQETPRTGPKEPLVDVTGYGQFQYESHQDSDDQLRQDGSLYNQNRFLVRRLRVTIAQRWQYSGFLVELDGNTTNGPAYGLQRAEGMLFYQGNPKGQPALLELTAGLFLLPFGYEVPESPRTRWFVERTTASRAFFPTEVDVGARLHGAWRFLRYGVALNNGEPKGTKATSFQLQDPNRAKDVTLRVGADVPASDAVRVIGGVSYLAGKGFSAGTPATKTTLKWDDANQDGVVQAPEISGNPGKAAVPSQNFRRWAVAADLQLKLRSALGWTTLLGEVVAASNLDRGLFVADPIKVQHPSNRSVREFGWHVGITQEVTRYAVVGFRFDSYDPDSDLLDSRAGQYLPNDQTISTYSPLVGLTLPDRARLVFQYDFVRDSLGRDSRGVPTDLANDQWTLRLQVSL